MIVPDFEGAAAWMMALVCLDLSVYGLGERFEQFEVTPGPSSQAVVLPRGRRKFQPALPFTSSHVTGDRVQTGRLRSRRHREETRSTRPLWITTHELQHGAQPASS